MIDFPNNPTVGDTFVAPTGITYKWNGESWRSVSSSLFVPEAPNDGKQYARQSKTWEEVSATGLWVGDLPPVDPVKYPQWWNSVNGILYVWYNDGNSSQWVVSVPTAAGIIWGAINGDINLQLDLKAALNGKVNDTGDTMTGDLLINKANPMVFLRDTADGVNQVQGQKPDGTALWHLHLGAGANKDFGLYRQPDGGAAIQMMGVGRGNGNVWLGEAAIAMELKGLISMTSQPYFQGSLGTELTGNKTITTGSIRNLTNNGTSIIVSSGGLYLAYAQQLHSVNAALYFNLMRNGGTQYHGYLAGTASSISPTDWIIGALVYMNPGDYFGFAISGGSATAAWAGPHSSVLIMKVA